MTIGRRRWAHTLCRTWLLSKKLAVIWFASSEGFKWGLHYPSLLAASRLVMRVGLTLNAAPFVVAVYFGPASGASADAQFYGFVKRVPRSGRALRFPIHSEWDYLQSALGCSFLLIVFKSILEKRGGGWRKSVLTSQMKRDALKLQRSGRSCVTSLCYSPQHVKTVKKLNLHSFTKALRRLIKAFV